MIDLPTRPPIVFHVCRGQRNQVSSRLKSFHTVSHFTYVHGPGKFTLLLTTNNVRCVNEPKEM